MIALSTWFLALNTVAAETIKIELEGINGKLARNIRHHLSLSDLPCDTREAKLANALTRADEEISAAARALGYYHARWQTTYQPSDPGDGEACWQVTIQIQAGEPATLSDVNIDITGPGSNDSEFTALVAQFPLAAGDQVNHGNYEAAKKKLSRTATRLGYFSAAFTVSELRVDRKSNTAQVNLKFETGPRARFGRVSFPDIPLEKDLLERYMTFAEGDQYDAQKLIAFQSRLINSQYFESVYFNQTEPDPVNQTVDISVDLTVKSRYESLFGAGFSTDSGPRASYTLKNRRFSADGKTYEFHSLWSPVHQQVGVKLDKPGADPTREKTTWSVGWQRENSDTVGSQSYQVERSRAKVLDNGWTMTRSITLLAEDYDIADQSGYSTLLYPGLSLARSRSNDPAYPTRGWRLAGGVKGALEEILSETSFAQITLDAKGILPFAGGRLIGRTGLGATFAENFDDIPASLRFFAGGDNSVRGYDYQSLGPEDDNDEVLGGKHLLTASIEYDHPVRENYGAALFFDTGTAFDTSDFTFHESVGFGARWYSPIGPVRLDFAFPLDGGFRLHLSMGPDL